MEEWASPASVEPSRSRVKLVFLASPNNPSGNWLPDDDLRRLLALPIVVVLDEAYVEFSGRESRVSWVADHANLIVVRTFSKVAGMAGLRLGYAVCPEWLMPHLWKFKQPYNVNVAATVAGLASLRSRSEIDKTAALIRAERDRLYAHVGKRAGVGSHAVRGQLHSVQGQGYCRRRTQIRAGAERRDGAVLLVTWT